MIETMVLALGLVLIVEGLVLALAPSRLQDLLALLAQTRVETRRLIGLFALAIGIGLAWLAHFIGA